MCTFVNTQQGSITIVKDSVPDGPTPFSFTASAPLTPTSFTLDDDGGPTPFPNSQTFANVPAGGPYTITETPAAGFTLTAPVSCTGTSTVTPTTNGMSITLVPGDNVVCTFVNVDPSASAGGSSPPNPPTRPAPPGPTGATGPRGTTGTAFTGFDPSSPVSGGVRGGSSSVRCSSSPHAADDTCARTSSPADSDTAGKRKGQRLPLGERWSLLDALSAAADEITTDLAPGPVSLRFRGPRARVRRGATGA